LLSKSTEATDRAEKMPGVRRAVRVKHVWLVDPVARTLEVYRLEGPSYLVVHTWRDDARGSRGAHSMPHRARPVPALERLTPTLPSSSPPTSHRPEKGGNLPSDCSKPPPRPRLRLRGLPSRSRDASPTERRRHGASAGQAARLIDALVAGGAPADRDHELRLSKWDSPAGRRRRGRQAGEGAAGA